MKKRLAEPRRDCRVTSQFSEKDGTVLIGVAKGWTGSGEILYRIEQEKLAGAIEDRKELAVIINNLGLLVLAQLTGFNLAESLDGIPKALARWGHINIEKAKADEAADIARALEIARKTLHGTHGHSCDFDNGIECGPCVCQCTGTPDQTICAGVGCEICAHFDHGRGTEADGPDDPDCPCRGTGQQYWCARERCGFCRAAEEMKQ